MKNVGFNVLIIIPIILFSSASTPNAGAGIKINKVVIDAGHGGKDPGTSGEKILEKHIALSVALKLGEYINQYLPTVKVIYTRKKDNFVPLEKRAEIANKNKVDLFISIHANSIKDPTIYGTETYVMGKHKTEQNLEVAKRENAVILLDENDKETYESFNPNSPESYILFSLTQNAFRESSMKLAHLIEEQFQNRGRRKSRGVKENGFLVLWRTSMPSILIEVGYLTNREEERFLSSNHGQSIIASGIYRAVRDYKKLVESVHY